MKTKSLLLGLTLLLSVTVFGQQLGDGQVPEISSFDAPLLSGFYKTHTDQTKFPPSNWGYPYKFLLNVRTGEDTAISLHQWQIATEWADDDRIYFRKVYPYSVGVQAIWHELATRGGNTFIGTQRIDGSIIAKEVRVQANIWADFVFKKGYKLPTLREVETHINEKGTLIGVPNESDVKTNGVNLAETNALLLQKVEELTLYILQQEKRIEALETKMK